MDNTIFKGPWQVCKETSLEQKPNLRPGEILKHPSGNILLGCPKCNALQFATVGIEGDDLAPTLRGVVLCGSGNCVRCKYCFTIRAGKTVESEMPPPKRIEIPKIKGVKPPPKL